MDATKNITLPVAQDAVADASWQEKLKPLSLQTLQLALVSLVIYRFNIEMHLGLPQLLPFVLVAFIINALMPREHRLKFFFFASLAPIFYFFGWQDGSLLVGFAMLMIGTAHLPIPYWVRKWGVIAEAALLAYIKYTATAAEGAAGFTLSSQIVSMLGAMFMFRMILYIYELQYEKANDPTTIWQRLSYFFMLPNICFPIFPIVDWKTFKRTYYDQADFSIYQRGVNLIVLGAVQLIAYRVLYYLTPSAAEVNGFWTLLRYLVLSYLLLLRLNGILNMAVGLLRIFGFNLPDIFNYMFLARGFDDYWRKLNIYWKDFLVKIIYYPIYFRYRKRNTVFALTVATLVTFAFNWAFHAYQWFWILGTFSVRSTEVLMWTILGLLVLFAVLQQQRKPKPGTANRKPASEGWNKHLRTTGNIIGTFLTLTLVYSLLVTPNLTTWGSVLGQAGKGSLLDWLGFVGLIGAVWLIGAYLFHLTERGAFQRVAAFFKSDRKIVGLNVLLLAAMLFSSTKPVDKGVRMVSGYSTKPFLEHHLNIADQRKQFDGYYEEILFSDNFSSPLWQMEAQKPDNWFVFKKLDLMYFDGLHVRLKPSSETVFKNATLTTNRWGFRDREYEKVPPPNTLRMAIVGGSAEMGPGVADELVFEQQVEDRLNEKHGTDGQQFEILNFAISGMSIIRNIEKMEKEVLDFQPDKVIIFGHKQEEFHAFQAFEFIEQNRGTERLPKEKMVEMKWLERFDAFVEDENLKLEDFVNKEEQRAIGWKVLEWGYGEMKRMCDERGIELIMMYQPHILRSHETYEPFEEITNKYGIPFINLMGVFEGESQEDLQLAAWDNHVNTYGHGLLADRIYEELVEHLDLD